MNSTIQRPVSSPLPPVTREGAPGGKALGNTGIVPPYILDKISKQTGNTGIVPPWLRGADQFSAPAGRAPVALRANAQPLLGQTASADALFAPRSAALSLASGAGPTVPQVELDPGQTGSDVQNLQSCLVALGYMSQDTMNTGPGNYGPATTAAVQAFQADVGLPQVGRFGPGTRAAMNTAIGHLPTVQGIIQDEYRSLLGRNADPGGLANWTRTLTAQSAQGASDAQLRANLDSAIRASDEFRNKPPSNDVATNIRSLYNQVLERPADDGGLANFTNRWNQLARQGMGASDIMNTLRNEMMASPEYNVKEGVKDLYRNLLGREADPDGRQGWTKYGLNRMAQGASYEQARNEIASQIMQSPEYIQKHPVGRPVGSVEQANQFFVSQWGPTPFNNGNPNGSTRGFSDCGPTSGVMLAEALGLIPRTTADNAEDAIDAMRDRVFGFHKEQSDACDETQVGNALDQLGGHHDFIDMSTQAVDQALAEGRMVLLAGDPWGAWGANMDANGQYLNHRDPGPHFVTVLGKAADGNYIVGDPLSRIGAIEVNGDQLRDFWARGGGNSGAMSVWR